MSPEETLERVKSLLGLLSPKRASDYNEWIKIGMIVNNTTRGSREGLELFDFFSKRTVSGNYDRKEVVKAWYSFKSQRASGKPLTIGTLNYYAKIDNRVEYNKLYKKNRNKLYESAIMGGQYDLAKILKEHMINPDFSVGDVIACASAEKNIWFSFEQSRWVKTECGITLRQMINSVLVKLFERYSVERMQTLANEKINESKINEEDYEEVDNYFVGDEDTEERPTLSSVQSQAKQREQKLDEFKKSVNRLLINLKSTSFKNNIMKESVEVFYRPNMIKKLDSNPDLLGFTNGVYDHSTFEFRECVPSDYVSLTTGYDYVEFEEDSEEMKELSLFLIKIFPDVQLREYFLDYATSLLKGGNYNKNILIWQGTGNNGKSKVIELIEMILGEYSFKLPTSLLFQKRTASSSATPELARAQGKRFSTIQEPDSKDEINVGLLKELTGNDKIYARGLYQEGTEFEPQFKMSLICNKFPALSGNDEAVWNRIRVLDFETRFMREEREAPKTFEEQLKVKKFPMDPNFSVKKLRDPFMFTLISRVKQYHTQPKFEPAKVSQSTNRYRERTDVFRSFDKDVLIKGDNFTVTLKELKKTFRDWFATVKEGTVPENLNQELEDYFSIKCNIHGERESVKYFTGVKIKNPNNPNEIEDVADNDNEE